ncbi:MAG: protein kinase [Polyangia bacterium]
MPPLALHLPRRDDTRLVCGLVILLSLSLAAGPLLLGSAGSFWLRTTAWSWALVPVLALLLLASAPASAGVRLVLPRAPRLGDLEVRLLLIGLALLVPLALPRPMDGGLPSGYSLLPLGVLLLELAQSLVLLRRYLCVRRRMKDSAAVLELQGALLTAAARMARGDLDSVIRVPARHELAPLAAALDGMRLDLRAKVALLQSMQSELRAKVDALQARNLEVQRLNEELRRQIEQRSRRLIDALLPRSVLLSRPQQPALQPGDPLGEHYRVLRRLGQGGMGAVYEVERTTDHRRLAAKVLHTTPETTALRRLAREAQIMARLDHPNLVAVADVDVTPAGVLFLVMELVAGRPLSRLRARFGDVVWGRGVLRQIARALAVLHARRIVHRDLKPDNVLVVQEAGPDAAEEAAPRIKLADFGISLLLDGETPGRPDPAVADEPPPGERPSLPPGAAPSALVESGADLGFLPTLTPTAIGLHRRRVACLAADAAQNDNAAPAAHGCDAADAGDVGDVGDVGEILGTPRYIAPELLRGSHGARPAADVFSFGVLAFEVLTGAPPFPRPAIELCASGQPLTLPPTLRSRAGLPSELAGLLERCLASDPRHRPTAEQLAAAC